MARIVNPKYRNIAYDDIKNRYYVTMDFGKDETGKRIKKSKSFKTITEAKKCLKDFEADKNKNLLVMPREETVGEYALYWLHDIKSISCETTTTYGYEKIINNHIIPRLGKIKLQQLTVQQLNSYSAYLKNTKQLSNNTIKKHQELLKSILKTAVDEEKILKNPMNKIEKIKIEQKEVKVYNTEQLRELFERVEGHPLEIGVKFAGYLGLRRGEINGLKWENVDFDKKYIFIKETRTAAGKKEISKGVKTQYSKRCLALPDDLIDLLKRIKQQQMKNQQLIGVDTIAYSYVFCKADGTLYRANYLSSEFKRFLVKLNLPIINFHALRHSFASVANEQGIPLFDISRLLGHGSTGITGKLYTHQFDKTNKKAVNAIAKAYKTN